MDFRLFWPNSCELSYLSVAEPRNVMWANLLSAAEEICETPTLMQRHFQPCGGQA